MNGARVVHAVAFAVCALLVACTIGPRAARFPPATSPEGVRATVTLSDSVYRAAELLEVGDSAVLLLTPQRQLVRVYYPRIRALVPEHGPPIHRTATPSAEQKAEWRALSRFPQGLSPAQLDALLAFYGQQRVEVRR